MNSDFCFLISVSYFLISCESGQVVGDPAGSGNREMTLNMLNAAAESEVDVEGVGPDVNMVDFGAGANQVVAS